jgi:[ribosomal protein S5]-alanine N-acetyltransferase
MSEALKKLSDDVLEDDTIFRAWVFFDMDNKGSVRVMEKAGMRYEGNPETAVYPNISNIPRDSLVYAKTRWICDNRNSSLHSVLLFL